MIRIEDYMLAKANGNIQQFRDDEVSRRIRLRYSIGAEQRIAFNMLKDPYNAEFIKELDEHEMYVSECKVAVDTEIVALEIELSKN